MDNEHTLLGGNVISQGFENQAFIIGRKFNELWKTNATEASREKALDFIANYHLVDVDNIVMKRSYPFIDENYMPRLVDLFNAIYDLRVIYVQRGFLSNIKSIVRRGFEPDFEKASARISDGYKAMASDWTAVKSANIPLLELNYDYLINPYTKENEIDKLLAFLSIDSCIRNQMLKFIKTK